MKRLSLLPLLWPVCAACQPVDLGTAIRRAREESPTVRAARANVEAARQATRGARARQSPQLSASGFLASTKPGAILRSAPGTMPDATMTVPPGDTAVANLMLMVPLFTGGSLQARVASAGAEERAALAELAEAQAEAGLMAEEAYLMALFARSMESAAEARVRAVEEMVRVAQARFDAGKDILASVQRVGAELAMAKRELAVAQSERQKALLELQSAMGADMATPMEVAGDLAPVLPEGSLDEFVARSRTNRGSVVAALARVAVAAFDLRAATGALGPQVYGQAMTDASSDRMMRGSTVGVVMSLSLWDGGERRAEAARMQAMRVRAEEALREARIAAEKQVRTAWIDLEVAAANAASAEASVSSALEALEVVRLRVEAGKGVLLEQLDALTVLVRARADLARAAYDQRRALARLYRASGTQAPNGSRP
ncbi:MAG: TolC family protein [Fimbriimonadaceae bacterium]|nr:TolC family protein [Fimbriimonadaceae bacterium]